MTMLTLFIARDKDPADFPDLSRDDYWLALEPPDRDWDPEDGSVAWHPYQAPTCANIGPQLWDALGLPPLEPGEEGNPGQHGRDSEAVMETLTWQGCYDDNWNGLITPESYQHPAKMANGLVNRIFDYAIERGWIVPGESVVVDCFGGVGSTAIIGASRGVKVLCCELEQRFVELAKQNFELHRRTWEACGDPLPVIVQGDSRRLCEVLGPALAACVISSPPFLDDISRVSKRGIGSAEYGNGTMTKEIRLAWANLDHEAFGAYLQERREVAGLSKAEVDRRIGTNTAYSFYEGRKGSQDQWRVPLPSTYRKIKDVLQLDDRFDSVLLDTLVVEYERRAMKMGHTEADYGTTEGQLGAMPTGSVDSIISSPPYSSGVVHGGSGIDQDALTGEHGGLR